jgi:hypothetical protein
LRAKGVKKKRGVWEEKLSPQLSHIGVSPLEQGPIVLNTHYFLTQHSLTNIIENLVKKYYY